MTDDQIIALANLAWHEGRQAEWREWMILLRALHLTATDYPPSMHRPRAPKRDDDDKDFAEYIEEMSLGGQRYVMR